MYEDLDSVVPKPKPDQDNSDLYYIWKHFIVAVAYYKNNSLNKQVFCKLFVLGLCTCLFVLGLCTCLNKFSTAQVVRTILMWFLIYDWNNYYPVPV